MTEQQLRPGRIRAKWRPDQDSAQLLKLYTERRLAEVTANTVRTERSYLRCLVIASIEFGGPTTLRTVCASPEIVSKIVREWSVTRATLNGMLAAALHLIDIVINDRREASKIKDSITGGLIPRPTSRCPWNNLPRTVGGSTHRKRRRPMLSHDDLLRIIAAAPLASPNEDFARRDQALMAVLCFSGVKSSEIRGIRAQQVQLLTGDKQGIWCGHIHGIPRYGGTVCVPLARDVEPYLRRLIELTADASAHIFPSIRYRNALISYEMIKIIRRQSVRNAGLPACDEQTLKDAYAAYLKIQGVTDYRIRDALGLKTMESLDRRLRPYRRAGAQRKVWSTLKVAGSAQDQGRQWRMLPLDN